MKTVFSTDMVCHVWAQRTQDEGKNSSRNVYFNGDTIYSYGDHFPMSTFIDNRYVLINHDSYSVTTAKHQGYVYSAIPSEYTRFYVSTEAIKIYVNEFYRDDRVKYFIKQIIDDCDSAVNSYLRSSVKRRKQSLRLDDIKSAIHRLNATEQLCNHFKRVLPVKYRKLRDALVDDNSEAFKSIEQTLQVERQQELQRKRTMEANRIEKAKTVLTRYIAGEQMTWEDRNQLRYLKKVYMRVEGDEVYTTQGASFPVDHAKRAFNMISLCHTTKHRWEANGSTIRVGHFNINYITEQGDLKAGCHFIEWDEIARIATQLGIYKQAIEV